MNENIYKIFDYDVSILTSVEEVEVLCPTWRQLQDQIPSIIINSDVDRYLSVLATEPYSTPHVFIISKNGMQEGIVVGKISKNRIPIKVGYKTIFQIKQKCLTIIYGGILFTSNKELSEVIYRVLKKELDEQRVDVIYFNNLRMDSPLYNTIMKSFPPLRRSWFHKEEKHWRMRIPKSIEDFYSARSKKHRDHLKQYCRKLEKAFTGQIKILTYYQESDFETALRDGYEIAKKTYQYALGCGFNDMNQKKILLQAAIKHAWFRGHILYINNRPVAYRFALKYQNIYYGDGIGYDPEWRQFRVGTILFLKVLEILCEEKVLYYDFGFGDSEYKNSYGDEFWLEKSFYLFSSKISSIMVNLIYSFALGTSEFLRYIIGLVGGVSRIKRIWRDRFRIKLRMKQVKE